ncbi:hypothetical protein SUGI_1136960 [Cryptomeria japonica]|uniref:abscisic acid receptor PYL2-like n=1 Tax=Cryptomeria japonica TaxID=3369 RepID=UPI002414AAB2|nr:abscisic acid receptor PYL2-like [Cryptomeria japonica]GLJ53321.1 hypothetical protein SUGI_1136960 [Cryptomeria japonica]
MEKIVSRVWSSIPSGLNPRDVEVVRDVILWYHTYDVPAEHCSWMVAQWVELVWSVVSRFDEPEMYKHFVRNCNIVCGDGGVGSAREVSLISWIPATTNTERLELLDRTHHVIIYRILVDEHEL